MTILLKIAYPPHQPGLVEDQLMVEPDDDGLYISVRDAADDGASIKLTREDVSRLHTTLGLWLGEL